MPGVRGKTAPDHIFAENNKSASMNMLWILPNDSFIRSGPYLLKAAIESLRSFWPQIVAVASITIPRGRRRVCPRTSFKEKLYMATPLP